MSPYARVILIPLMLGSLSCAEQQAGGVEFVVRDSAGVEIAESHGPLWGPSTPWSLSESPTLVIGSTMDDESQALFDVGDVIRMHDGRIAVANSGTGQIRFYDSVGTHVIDVGRTGDGPGEYRRVRRLWQTGGDSLATYDGFTSRVTVYSPALALARTVPLRPQGHGRQVFAMRQLGDASLLVQEVYAPEPPREGLFSDGPRGFARYTADGERINEIGQVPTGMLWGFQMAGSFAYTRAPFFVTFPPSTTDGVSIFIGSGVLPNVEQRAADGTLVRLIRWGQPARPVDSEAVESLRRWHLERDSEPESVQRARDFLEGLQYPETMPLYRSLKTDSDGFLWVEQYRTRWESERKWWVFDPDGRWLGEAPVPPDLDVKEIGSDYLIGVRRDEADVEWVVLYDLDRGT